MAPQSSEPGASRAARKAAPAGHAPRQLDKGWHARHVRWQAEGRIPPGQTALLYEDGTPVLDRRGYPRMWSEFVAVAMRPGQRSSRTIARERKRTEEATRLIEAARGLQMHVQPGLRPPPGRLFAVDVAGLILRGPAGGIGTSERVARTLAPLAAGGRHAAAVLMAAGGWPDEAVVREALARIGGKLAAIGLRLDWRKGGARMAKVRPPPA